MNKIINFFLIPLFLIVSYSCSSSDSNEETGDSNAAKELIGKYQGHVFWGEYEGMGILEITDAGNGKVTIKPIPNMIYSDMPSKTLTPYFEAPTVISVREADIKFYYQIQGRVITQYLFLESMRKGGMNGGEKIE